jgi:hypothetical protein
MNFGILKQFLEFKTIEKRFKTAAQCRAESGPRLPCTARWSATRGRPEGRLGHGRVARSNRGGGPRAAEGSPRATRARDGAVARLLVAR